MERKPGIPASSNCTASTGMPRSISGTPSRRIAPTPDRTLRSCTLEHKRIRNQHANARCSAPIPMHRRPRLLHLTQRVDDRLQFGLIFQADAHSASPRARRSPGNIPGKYAPARASFRTYTPPAGEATPSACSASCSGSRPMCGGELSSTGSLRNHMSRPIAQDQVLHLPVFKESGLKRSLGFHAVQHVRGCARFQSKPVRCTRRTPPPTAMIRG